MNVMALLPYMLYHYEDANALCIQAAESIAQVSQECSHEGKQLQNLATVMTLYSRRNFSKESFQWTKCVVKYLHDSYATQAAALLAFLVEILEKGPVWAQCPVLNIVYCLLHYTDVTAPPHTTPVTAELLSVIAKHMEGIHWKEALRILKLAVTGSSSLVLPPSSLPLSTASPTRGSDAPLDSVALIYTKKELPGRTMEFTFDLTQTPVIGRRLLQSQTSTVSSTTSSAVSSVPGDSVQTLSVPDGGAAGLGTTPPCIEGMAPLHSSVSPRRCSVAPFDTAAQAAVPWRRPWQSQVCEEPWLGSIGCEETLAVSGTSTRVPGQLTEHLRPARRPAQEPIYTGNLNMAATTDAPAKCELRGGHDEGGRVVVDLRPCSLSSFALL
ncbi:Cell morphogenesis protein C-terminal [Trinorchestia longiramus]|nr:Cell morphogenesis protein C-terminal [Trinorchestia longiramus]